MVSGVLGLGFGAPNPFLQAMLDQGYLGSPFFSLTIDQPDDSKFDLFAMYLQPASFHHGQKFLTRR